MKNFKSQCSFIKKETLAQVYSCEFCEISKNTFSQNTSERLLLYPMKMVFSDEKITKSQCSKNNVPTIKNK